MEELPKWNEPIFSTTEAKRQHYVPRTYLSPFMGDDNRIRVFDIVRAKEYRTSLNNVAVEGHYYDLEIDGVDVSVENWLAQLEAEVAPVIKRLLADPSSIEALTLGEEFALSRFVVALIFRTPAFREWEDSRVNTVVHQIKEIVENSLIHEHGCKAGKDKFSELKDNPTHWWLGMGEAPQAGDTSAYMLGETQGFANLIWAAPWRIGRAVGSLKLYASDNPASRYLPPIRPWWEGGAFASHEYYLPLSPDVLLKIERRPYTEDSTNKSDPRGQRRFRDFSEWEVSKTRHIISIEATRYLYGEGMVVPKRCAESCLTHLDQAWRKFAYEDLGFDSDRN